MFFARASIGVVLAAICASGCGDKVVGRVATKAMPATTTTTATQSTTITTAASKPAGTSTTVSTARAAAAPTTTTTKPAADPFAHDRENVKRLIVTAADVPGYEFDPEEVKDLEGEEPEPTTAEDAKCLGVDAPTLDRARTAAKTSPDFTKGELVLSSYTELYRDPALLVRVFNHAVSPEGRRCFMELFQAGAAEEAPPNAKFSATPLELGALGDQRFGYRLSGTISEAGHTYTFVDDVIFVRKGRAVLSFDFAGDNGPFPEAESRPIMVKVLARA